MRDAAAALGRAGGGAGRGAARHRRSGAARAGRMVPEGFGAVIARLPEAGEVMALTRNEACVHEMPRPLRRARDRGRHGPGRR